MTTEEQKGMTEFEKKRKEKTLAGLKRRPRDIGIFISDHGTEEFACFLKMELG